MVPTTASANGRIGSQRRNGGTYRHVTDDVLAEVDDAREVGQLGRQHGLGAGAVLACTKNQRRGLGDSYRNPGVYKISNSSGTTKGRPQKRVDDM